METPICLFVVYVYISIDVTLNPIPLF